MPPALRSALCSACSSRPAPNKARRYFVMAGQAGVSQGVSSALAISLVGGGLAIAPAILLIHGDIVFFQKADLRSFHLALILIPLVASSTAVEHQLAALRRFGRLAVFSLLRAAVNVLAIAALVWGGDLGVAGAVASFAAGHLVMIAACLRDLRRHCGLAPALPSRSSLTRVLGYGLRYHIARTGKRSSRTWAFSFSGPSPARPIWGCSRRQARSCLGSP